ncbi:MAG: 4Fe-4S ferredoxin [Dehalococcoidales bacterium]|jgi:ferredoxin|nr:4Fe-4S ferredoxin [Dehalococcoidales bacterium]|tara:strand:- start:1180 stop:2133 length:954 start_codon:yes stop_codon:yes gene_type:complete
MPELTNKIREVARDLLQQKKVDLVIGFARGTTPMCSTPCFVRQDGEVNGLIWDSFCENNLAKYLVKRSDKIAIIAKGCDARAVVELIKENQISRDQVVIIGVPCQGMVDRGMVRSALEGNEIQEVEEKDDRLIIKGKNFEKVLNRNEFLHPSCKVCTHRNPVIYDILVGDTVKELDTEPYLDVAEFEALTPEEREEYFSKEFAKCIRCYACRNACPLCYCQECFVDCSKPQWIGKTTEASDTAIFHIMRAFHLAGRCVECGACERACPMGVDIRKLNRKLTKDVKERFDYEAGLNLEEVAPLSTFKPDDAEEFILHP